MKKFSPTKIPMGGHKKFPPQGLEKWGGVNILPPHNGGEEQDISPPSKWGETNHSSLPTNMPRLLPPPKSYIYPSVFVSSCYRMSTDTGAGVNTGRGSTPNFSSAPSAPESVFQKSSERFQNVRAPQAEISRFLKSVNTISKGKSMTQTLGNAKIFRLRRAILFFTSPLKRFNRGGRRGKAWRCGKH